MSYAHRTRYAAGVVTAGLSAGPAFLACGALILAGQTNLPIAPDWSRMSPWIVLFLPLVMIVGFAISFFPIVVGAAVLSTLGRQNEGARLPAFWGLVGGMSAAGGAYGLNLPGEMAATLAATGTACALLCRRGTVWS